MLRVVQTQAILSLKLILDPPSSEIDFKNKMVWVWTTLNLASFKLTYTIKVKLDAMKPWIHEKLTEILGFEDDVVIDYAINQLEETNHPDPKAVQINLTGFLNAKVTQR